MWRCRWRHIPRYYAPESGRETREELGGRMDDVYAKAREEYEASLERPSLIRQCHFAY